MLYLSRHAQSPMHGIAYLAVGGKAMEEKRTSTLPSTIIIFAERMLNLLYRIFGLLCF